MARRARAGVPRTRALTNTTECEREESSLMSKYWLVILCSLAFLAGGAAHLALNRPADSTVGGEFAPAKPLGASPAAAEQPAPMQTAAPAQPADAGVQSPEGAEHAEAEGAKAEDAAVAGVGAEVVSVQPFAPHARRTRAARTRSVPVQRTTVTQSRVAAVPAAPKNVGSGRGLKDATVGGVKKTGSVLGKGLKKVGGVFHD
jgi:hypothetical protein